MGSPSVPAATFACSDAALRHHGDREATAGLVDLAVNVFDGPRPPWLDAALAGAELGRYPDPAAAVSAVAAAHGRDDAEVLATAGAAEAFGLIARLRPWRRPVVVHPQFTEPDVALRAAGHTPHHVLLRPATGFTLDPRVVPADADLVMVGNPTNPTGVLHPVDTLLSLIRPGRLVVVDEAFLDDGAGSLAGESRDGLVVLRSLTKLWAIPGVRAGYLLGPADVVARLADHQPPWSVSASAVAALVACASTEAEVERRRRVAELRARRVHLASALEHAGVRVVPGSAAPFVLAEVGDGAHAALREAGYAVRRGDTFPGLGPAWVRITARSPQVNESLVTALAEIRDRLQSTD